MIKLCYNRFLNIGVLMIKFNYNGKLYEVSMSVYDENKSIQMPDGKVMNVLGWLESYPPQPMGFEFVEDFFPETLNVEVAKEVL